MLDKLDLSKKLEKEEFKLSRDVLEVRLQYLQRKCKELEIPVMFVFEGFGASGKGTLINQLIKPFDPRGFRVYAINGESSEEQMRPFLWRFWTKIPSKGRIAIFDRSWYRRVLVDRFDKVTTKEQLANAYDEITSFERQLTDDGTVIIKFFLCITKKEQEKRFQKLLDSKETAWRVTQGDLKRLKKFDKYARMNEEMLQKTDTDYAPWIIVEAMNREYASIKVLTEAVAALEKAIQSVEKNQIKEKAAAESKAAAKDELAAKIDKEAVIEDIEVISEDEQLKQSNTVDAVLAEVRKSSVLDKADLTLSYSREEYKERLKKLQKKLGILHSDLYKKRIPVILAFEGWDAGGKGGAIKRLAASMDPRGYAVNPTASPNDLEKIHHYLWRFWRTVPKDGHIAIYDRTWYGRVMVERIEGFCSDKEWQRAYREINEMEGQFASHGAVVLKFWMHIDKDEQERRFNERMNNPEKQWKITEEDWRNREKWDVYAEAVDEMLIRTSTTYAPWIIVEGNDKYYARIKVLETVVMALENRLKEVK